MSAPVVCPHCNSVVEDTSGLANGAITCPFCAEEIEPPMVTGQTPEWVARHRGQTTGISPPSKPSDARVVSDVVIGPNLRMKDNVFQAVVILMHVLIGAGIGALFIEESLMGALAGVLGGLVLGLLVSGTILAVYRLFRH